MTLVHHYLYQLLKAGEEIYHAVMTNAQTKLIFGGASDDDAEVLAREVFRTEFDRERIVERTHEGLATAKKNGRVGGRPQPSLKNVRSRFERCVMLSID